MKSLILTTLLTLHSPLCALAQHHRAGGGVERDSVREDSVMRDVDLDQVVVTGTRTPKLLKDTPIQTRVITFRDIERTDATNVQDILQQELPGAEFAYAMSQQVNMNLSGFAGQGVLFLIDGERLAGESMDNVDFTRLTTSGIERIEIVRGAASALYGSNATGGVVNIITRRQQQPWTLRATTRWGEHGQQRHGLNWGLHQGRWESTLTLDRTASDTYDVVGKADPLTAQTRVFQQVYGEGTWNVREKLVWTPCSNLRLTGRAGYFFRTLSRIVDQPERYRDFSGGLRADWEVTERDHVEASYAYDQYDKSDYQRLTGLDIRDYSNVQNSFRMLYTHTFGGGHLLTAGGDYMHDYLFSANLDRPHAQDVADAFAQYDWRVNRHWELVGALRYDHFSETSLSRLTPKLSARYQLGRLNIRGGYGMGMRTATLKERHNNFDVLGIWVIEGNPDLRTETSHNVNLGWEYTCLGGFNLNVTGSYNRVRNRITTGAPYYHPDDQKQLYMGYINVDRADLVTVEATGQKRWTAGWGMKVSYVYNHEHLTTTNPNQLMPARAHSLNGHIDWQHRWSRPFGGRGYSLSATLNGRLLSAVDNEEYIDMYDIAKGTVTVHYPAYGLLRLLVTQRFADGVALTLTADNLLNYRPAHYYYNAPLTTGFNVMAGLTLDIDRLCRKR